jgi:hypothetical protein
MFREQLARIIVGIGQGSVDENVTGRSGLEHGALEEPLSVVERIGVYGYRVVVVGVRFLGLSESHQCQEVGLLTPSSLTWL